MKIKKILFKLSLLAFVLTLPLVGSTNSYFSDTEICSGNTFTAGDWTAPSKPTGLTIYKGHDPATRVVVGCGGYTNNPQITIDWNPNPESDIDYYWFGTKFKQYHKKVYAPTSEYHANMTPGHNPYYYTVIAVDKHGNQSEISEQCGLTLDQISPETTLEVHDGDVVSQAEEEVVNGSFETGGSIVSWVSRGTTERLSSEFDMTPKEGTQSAKIGDTEDYGKEVWLNGLGQSIASGAKNLSFWYNFYTYDDAGYDEPGFSVKVNNKEVFNLWASDVWDYYYLGLDIPAYTGWQQMSVDLTQFETPYLGVSFYAGNTNGVLGDYYNQSWVYLDKVTTTEVMANESTKFYLSTEEGATIYYQIQEGEGPFQEDDWQPLDGEFFTLSEQSSGDYTIYYRAIDLAGNKEIPNILKVYLDNEEPSPISFLEPPATPFIYSVELLWDAPEDNGKRAASYDIRYWEKGEGPCGPSGWDSDNAASVPFPPVPRFPDPNEFQDFEITGLEPETDYCFAIKTCDSALNCSAVSDVVSATTLEEKPEPASLRDVIINELMWMGSNGSDGVGGLTDEWIELKNTRDCEGCDIDISGWQLTKLVSGTDEKLMLVIPNGKVIPANGYFLIANFDKSSSKINVEPDLVDTSVVLVNGDLQIKLYKGAIGPANLIDIADDGEGSPAAGEHDIDNNIYYSMERNDEPGDGTDPDSWHTCEDALTTIESWDGGASEQGTQGGPNRSPGQGVTLSEPSLGFFLRNDKKAIGFRVENVTEHESLKYEIVYDTENGDKGIVGNIEIDGQATILRGNLVLGTCSGIEGKVCTYDQGVTKITLKVTLINSSGEEEILEKEIDY